MVTVTGKSRLGRLFGKDGRGYEPQVVNANGNCGKSLDVTVASPSLQNRQKTPKPTYSGPKLLRSTQNRPEPLRSDKNPGKIAPKMAQNRSICLSHLGAEQSVQSFQRHLVNLPLLGSGKCLPLWRLQYPAEEGGVTSECVIGKWGALITVV